MKHAAAFFFFVTLAAAQSDPPITREGPYWVQTITGSIPAPTVNHLRVEADGNLTGRGISGTSCTYSLKRKVRARDAEQAKQALRGWELKSRSFGGFLQISAYAPTPTDGSSDLEIAAPRHMSLIRLETRGGNVQAFDLDGMVEMETGAGRLTLDRLKGNVTARTAGGDVSVGRVGGLLRCFSGGGSLQIASTGGESWFETAGGEISIANADGPVHCSTGGGNIRVQSARSTISARTAGGIIEVGHAGGAVSLETVGGSIQVNSAQSVQCQALAGAIRLRNVGGSVRASTAAGNILAELLSGRSFQDSFLTTAAGDITVLIPSNLAMAVAAATDGGRIVSDFPELRISQSGMARLQATLNGGGPLLRIQASGGGVFLRRAK